MVPGSAPVNMTGQAGTVIGGSVERNRAWAPRSYRRRTFGITGSNRSKRNPGGVPSSPMIRSLRRVAGVTIIPGDLGPLPGHKTALQALTPSPGRHRSGPEPYHARLQRSPRARKRASSPSILQSDGDEHTPGRVSHRSHRWPDPDRSSATVGLPRPAPSPSPPSIRVLDDP